MQTQKEGFGVESGKVHITDPCYSNPCITLPAKNGTWHGQAFIEDSSQRVKAIIVARSGSRPVHLDSYRWKKLPGTVGVDSGQAGVFDARANTGQGDYGDRDTFYGRACHATLPDGNDTHPLDRFGHIEEGFVSSSGYGDGGYDAYGIFDGDELTAVKIVFIEEGESEPW